MQDFHVIKTIEYEIFPQSILIIRSCMSNIGILVKQILRKPMKRSLNRMGFFMIPGKPRSHYILLYQENEYTLFIIKIVLTQKLHIFNLTFITIAHLKKNLNSRCILKRSLVVKDQCAVKFSKVFKIHVYINHIMQR